VRRYLGNFVFGGGDEVGAIGGHLEVCDLHALFVRLDVFEELSGLRSMVSITLSLEWDYTVGTFASYWDTVPSSCPARIYFDK